MPNLNFAKVQFNVIEIEAGFVGVVAGESYPVEGFEFFAAVFESGEAERLLTGDVYPEVPLAAVFPADAGHQIEMQPRLRRQSHRRFAG